MDTKSWEDVRLTIQEFEPDIVGISAMTVEIERALRIAQCAKAVNDNCKVIIGGPHTSTNIESIFKSRVVDFAVFREGERTLCELVECIEEDSDPLKVDGIGFIRNGEICSTNPRQQIENLDDIPFPAWDLVNVERYTQAWNMQGYLAKKNYFTMVTSRGCPFNCIYCHDLFGKSFRSRSPKNVVEEMRYLYDRYSVREFHIIDDIFNFDKKRVIKICELIEESEMKIKIAFPNGVRGDLVDEEVINELKRAGCYSITYAIESASKRMQRFIRKNLDLRKVEAMITSTARIGIITNGFFMLGFPGETEAEMQKTIEFARRSDLHFVHFFQVRPFPNTELGKSLSDTNIQCRWEDFEYTSDRINLSALSDEDFMRIYRRAYFDVYLARKRIEALHKILSKKMFMEFYRRVLNYANISEDDVDKFLGHLLTRGARVNA